MNVPTLPTDNLYKFIAIFGLIIFMVGTYIAEVSDVALHRTRLEYDLIESKLSMDSLNFEQKYNEANQKLKEYKLDSLNQHLNVGEEIKKYRENLKDAFENYLSTSDEHYKIRGDFEFYINQEENYEAYSIILSVFGAFLMVFGFTSWYKKYQVYIDAETKWKGEAFIERLKDAEAKKKASQEELNNIKDENENENDTDPTVSES